MIFMTLLVVAFAAGMYVSLEAGETIVKTLVRSIPIFLVMFVFYKLRKMDIDSKQKQVTKNNTESADKNK